MKNILGFMKIFLSVLCSGFLRSKRFKTLVTCGVVFALKTRLKTITGRLRPVIKLVLGFGFDFGNENQITCTRSNRHAFENVLLAYENGLLLCLEKVLGTNRIKLGLGGKRWCELLSFCCHDRCNSLSECLLARASVTGHDNTPGRAPERVRPVLTAFTRCQLARASYET
ncbi:hypothetical protein QL285_058158 [Trifolium repens]|nr:hypothetical protein QL285_058158 [Trifolium repens]